MWIWRKAKKNLKVYAYIVWNPINRIVMLFNNVKCGKGLRSRGKIFVSNPDDGKIIIGNNVILNSGDYTNPIGCGNKIWFQVLREGKLTIGDNAGLSNTAITCIDSVEIGEGTLIGSGTRIFDMDFHKLPLGLDEEAYKEKTIKRKPVKIGSNVFIGADSMILKGTVIEDNAIIGAGSVLAGVHVGAGEVWAGNPAVKKK